MCPLRVGKAACAVNPSKTGVGPAAPPPDLPEVRRMTQIRTYDGITVEDRIDFSSNPDMLDGLNISQSLEVIALELGILNAHLQAVAEYRGEVER